MNRWRRARAWRGLVATAVWAIPSCAGAPPPSESSGADVAREESPAPPITTSAPGTGSSSTTTGPLPSNTTSGEDVTAVRGEAERPAASARPGRYSYDTEGQTYVESPVPTAHPLPEVTTLEVFDADGGRQRFLRDLRDDDGSGTVTETVLEFRGADVYLESLVITSAGVGTDVVFEFLPEDPPRVAVAGASPGFRTEFTLTSTDGSVTLTVQAAVVGERRVSVDGVEVVAQSVDTRTKFEGSVTGSAESLTDIALDDGIAVREESTSELTWGISRFRTHYVASLRSLEPA